MDLKHPSLKKITKKSIATLDFIKKLDSELNFIKLISPYSSYLSFGALVRYSLMNKKKCLLVVVCLVILKKMPLNRPLHSENSLNFKSMFENLKNKEEKIKLSRKEMDEKFSGKKSNK